jgi:hypothetical protein
MIALLLTLLALADGARTYHHVPLERVAASSWTHIETCGPVVYVRKQQDGDWHLTLAAGAATVVIEIIPAMPLAVPRKGQTIRVSGISRFDKGHGFVEIHPAEAIAVVASCATATGDTRSPARTRSSIGRTTSGSSPSVP